MALALETVLQAEDRRTLALSLPKLPYEHCFSSGKSLLREDVFLLLFSAQSPLLNILSAHSQTLVESAETYSLASIKL